MAAKIVSKLLKPLVEKYPIILTKSQDLAEQIDNLIVPPRSNVYLVTWDVKSFYTNVNHAHIPATIKKAILRHDPRNFDKIDLTIKLALLSNDHLIFCYGNNFFIQAYGLAIGMHHSPDIANLYAAEEEISFDTVGGVRLDRRYIDDIFSVIIATSPQEALATVRRLDYKGLEINWSVTEYSQMYLDMYIKWDSSRHKFSYKPYKKPLNHFERIPANSYHRRYVKKAVILGELGRLARISSSREIYHTAVVELRDIYVSRGYTARLVQNIIDGNCSRLWHGRRVKISKDESPAAIVALKTEMNPVWDDVNLEDIREAIHGVWRTNDSTPDSLFDMEFILSKSRSQNLGDILNIHNKEVLNFDASRQMREESPSPFDFIDGEL